MFHNKFVFAQLVSFLDRNHFNYLVRKYNGDRYIKHLTCWNQFIAMMFGQLANSESLRDLIVVLDAHRSKCYHLGMGKNISKSSLARANQDREFVFLTNATHISSLVVAELYKNRWQIELFFKWLKQHLKIKKFWGTAENAVRIQIYIAISTYLLVSIVKHDMQLDRSIYEILQILNISLTDKTH